MVLLLQAGLVYSPAALFSLLSITGLSAASSHMVAAFVVKPQNARVLSLLSVAVLALPALASGWLMQPGVSLAHLQATALLCGLGGGSFAALALRIRQQPYPQQEALLGLGSGLGHLGIAVSQMVLPLLVTVGLYLVPPLPVAAGHISTFLGSLQVPWFYPAQAGYFWPLLISLLLPVGVLTGGLWRSLGQSGRWLKMLLACPLVCVAGLWLTLPPEAGGSGLQVSRELVLAAVVLLLLIGLRFLPDGEQQLRGLLNNRHTWIMSLLYAMSLGSLLGLAIAMPLTLELVFAWLPADGTRIPNPNAPGIFTYVWMGGLVGVLAQPAGTWLAKHYGWPEVSRCCAFVMLLTAAGIAFYFRRAWHASEPEQFFLPLLMLVFILFAAAGACYAALGLATRQLFPDRQWLVIRVWLTGVASYGMFYVPHLLGEQLTRGTPEQALIGFALFYGLCLLISSWFYPTATRR